MAKIPTVRIKNERHPDGYMLINESDFDPKKHKLYEEKKKKETKKPAKKKAKKDD